MSTPLAVLIDSIHEIEASWPINQSPHAHSDQAGTRTLAAGPREDEALPAFDSVARSAPTPEKLSPAHEFQQGRTGTMPACDADATPAATRGSHVRDRQAPEDPRSPTLHPRTSRQQHVTLAKASRARRRTTTCRER